MNWNNYPNFSKWEFECSHTGLCDMRKDFLEKLQLIRTEYGKPMTITSGYRHPTHPIEARKERAGEHSLGACCDVSVEGEDAYELLGVAIRHGITRIGIQQKGEGRFLHLGIGERGLLSPWIWSY